MPEVNLVDLGNLSQVFLGAKLAGMDLELVFCCSQSPIISSVNLPLGDVKLYKEVKLQKGDYIIVISSFHEYILSESFQPSTSLLSWLRKHHENGIQVCAVCNASILLAKAGLLDNRKCTTNWLRTAALKRFAPKAHIIENILYYDDKGIITGAGGTASFDLGLYIVGKLGGGMIAYEISKRMVLFQIRQGQDQQISFFLKHRHHHNHQIHQVQDLLFNELDSPKSLTELAELACMSERNFTRVFKKETGLSVKKYVQSCRRERALQLLNTGQWSHDEIASVVGLKSERQLRRIINNVENELQ